MKPLAAAAAALLAPVALAAAPVRRPASADDATEQAKAHFRRGTELYRQARYRDAIAEFEAAYKLKPHGVLHYNVAQCHEKLGDIPAALRSYHDYLREVPDAEDKANVLAAMANLESRLAATGVQQMLVYTDPPGAEVIVDGQSRGRTPFSMVLPHGMHLVSLVKGGFKTWTREVVLSPDRSLHLDLTLEKGTSTLVPPPPAAPALATPEPSPATPLTAPQPVPTPARPRVWTWVAAGVAVAAAGAGAYFGAQARSRSDELRDGTIRTSAENQRLHDEAQSRARTANVLYGVAGAAGAAGVALFFVEGSF